MEIPGSPRHPEPAPATEAAIIEHLAAEIRAVTAELNAAIATAEEDVS